MNGDREILKILFFCSLLLPSICAQGKLQLKTGISAKIRNFNFSTSKSSWFPERFREI